MAIQAIDLGQAANDGTGDTLRTAFDKVNDNFGELYGLISETINAAAYPGATSEISIQAAIDVATATSAERVFVPSSMLPYDGSAITFDPNVQMVREGGVDTQYDILAYGAATGGSDVTPAVNAAVAAAVAAGGGVVFSPPGFWYFLTTPTTLAGTLGIIFRGSGRNVTHWVMGAEGVWVFKVGAAAVRIQILDMWIGTFTNYTTGGGIEAISPGYPSNQISEVIMERVTLQNLPYPFYWDNVTQAGMRDVRYLQTRASATVGDAIAFATAGSFPCDGVRIDSDSDSIFAMRCEMVLMGNGAATAGWRVMDSVSGGNNPPRIIRMTDCTAENGNVGFEVSAARDVRMEGCEAANNLTYGFYVTGGKSVGIVNSQSFLNDQHGIYIQGGEAVLVEGNTSSNNSQAANATYDGMVIGTALGARVANNRSGDMFFTLANKQRTGLNLTAAADYVWLSGNDLRTNTGLGFEQPILNNSTGANLHSADSAFFAISEAVLVAGKDTESLGTVYLTVTLTAARVVGLLFTPFKGQRASFTFIQDGTGGWAVTWNAIYKHAWSDTGNTLSKRSTISFVYDGTNWNQDSAQSPYI